MLKKILQGILAGILIGIGGSVFLACENRYVGAVLFSVALLCICINGYSLFTGKVGFIPEKHGKEEFSVLLLGLLGNAIATIVCGYALRFALPNLAETANTICASKLTQTAYSTFIRAVFCGILMYLAVGIYKKGKIVGIIFCIPVFILSGFEHSIADIFYFATSGIVSLRAFFFLLTVIVGNAFGSVLMSYISIAANGVAKNEK